MGLDLLSDAVSELGRSAELALVNVGNWVSCTEVASLSKAYQRHADCVLQISQGRSQAPQGPVTCTAK